MLYTITKEGSKNSKHIVWSSDGGVSDNTGTNYAFYYAKGKKFTSIQSMESIIKKEDLETIKVNFLYEPIGVAKWATKAPRQEFYPMQNNKSFMVMTYKKGKGWFVHDR